MTFRAVKTSLRKQHDKAIRQGLRHRRTEIRAAIKEAKTKERLTLAKVREQCRRSRARVAERVAKLRDETRRAVNAEADLLRTSAKGACSNARARAKRQTREQLQRLERAEREAKTDLLREKNFTGYVKRAERRRLPDRHVETDEEVADNLAAELRPVWHEMRKAFKPEPRRSRTEAFLEWAEANPDEVLALQVELGEQATEALLDAQEEQQAEVERLLEQRDLSLADLASLGISRETVSEAGYDPDNPAHLRAFLTGQEPPPAARQRPAARKPKRERQSDSEKLRDAVVRMGVGLKEPEAAAMLDWSEERAWKAAKAALRAKLLERVNGELVLPGPERERAETKERNILGARMTLSRAEREAGARKMPKAKREAPPEEPVTLQHPTEPWRQVTLTPSAGGYLSKLSTGAELLIPAAQAAEDLRDYLAEGWTEVTPEAQAPTARGYFVPDEPDFPGWVPKPGIPPIVANHQLMRPGLREAARRDLAAYTAASESEQRDRGGVHAQRLLRDAADDGAPGPILRAAVVPGAQHIRAELRRQLLERGYTVKEHKKPETFKEARERLLGDLQAEGWKLAKAGAKTPKLRDPANESTIWFKPQAIYVAHGNAPALGTARSLVSDYRDVSMDQLLGMVQQSWDSEFNRPRPGGGYRGRSWD